MPINIGCQNTDSQIQGDENAVAQTAQQTFPEVKFIQEKPSHPPKTPPPPPPEPQTCEECFRTFLTPEQIAAFENTQPFGNEFETLEEICARLEELTPEQQMDRIRGIGVILEDPVHGLGFDPQLVDQIVECLIRVLGLQTEEPLEG